MFLAEQPLANGQCLSNQALSLRVMLAVQRFHQLVYYIRHGLALLPKNLCSEDESLAVHCFSLFISCERLIGHAQTEAQICLDYWLICELRVQPLRRLVKNVSEQRGVPAQGDPRCDPFKHFFVKARDLFAPCGFRPGQVLLSDCLTASASLFGQSNCHGNQPGHQNHADRRESPKPNSIPTDQLPEPIPGPGCMG